MTLHITEKLNLIASPSIENEQQWVDHLRKVLAESSREEFFDAADEEYQREIAERSD